MKSSEIRSAFLKYFESKQHQVVTSSPLIPANDPTLLFTNAGMVQFKDVFLGQDKRSYQRATTSQRVVRAGGKHNDLENVGYTARHHTFFEMLGNFSFGDYFKSEAIAFAWEFLTQVLKLPAEKLWVTVYKDDQEAEKIWFEEIGINPQKFSRLGKKDNFWSMGDTGPCGPCSEIFYDHGEVVPGGPPGSPEEDGDRYIEVWNLVFMQYDRKKGGELVLLPRPSVDTGMGLERIAAVMQGVHNNYEIDLFVNLIHSISKITGTEDKSHQSLRVIADHIRACSFLICDSVVPSNEGRGYVLRRIIRRALRHGSKLGVSGSFFHRCVVSLVVEMGTAYPELKVAQQNIEKILKHEEEQFAVTLEQGLKILEQDIHHMAGRVISGETLFTLYDTYGFPVDLTADIARERNLDVDMIGFDRAMERQKARSKQKNQFERDYSEGLNLQDRTEFSGYKILKDESKISAIYVAGKKEDVLVKEQEGLLVLQQTPFYAESGGQIGDSGILRQGNAIFQVLDTTKDNQAVIHRGKMIQGEFKSGLSIQAEVDEKKRISTARNHSATHLLHAALRKVLGSHVTQKGSLVDSEKLRFDFSHLTPVVPEELLQIEALVNLEIRANTLVTTEIMDIKTAKNQGALALFGEKYDDAVRVLSMGTDQFSVELCGGTHVQRTGDIGLFKLVGETGIASGIRRIDALTGEKALDWVAQIEEQQRQLAALLKAQPENLIAKLESSLEKQKQLEKELQKMQSKQAATAGADLLSTVEKISGVNVLRAQLDNLDSKSLRELMDQLKNKLHSGVILLATSSNGKVQLAAGVTSDLTKKYSAGDLVKKAAAKVGGKGGGRSDMAMAGGNQSENIPEALLVVETWLLGKSNSQ